MATGRTKRGAKNRPPGASVEVKASRMEARLREMHALGRTAEHAEENGKSTSKFAVGQPYSEHTLRKLKAFARHFSQVDLDELCRARRPNGLPLHWGYIPYLLAIESKHGRTSRQKLQTLALEEGWTVPQLNREVRKRFGVQGHGRPIQVSDDLKAELDGISDDLGLLQRRCEKLEAIAQAKRSKSISTRCRRLLRALEAAQKAAGQP